MEHNLRQSVGAGMRSVFGGKGRTYYVLRHLSSTALHQAGEEQEIIIDYVEIGRDPSCQVRFDETQRTVSRRHAAIVRENNTWVIRNLSDKNPTLINGRPVNKQWFLNPGDQIQLSMEGPKMGFIVPANPSVASIPLTRRLNLFRQQALLPYKRALIGLSIVFALTVAGLSYWLFFLNKQNIEMGKSLASAIANAKEIQGNVDSLRTTQKLTVQENNRLRQNVRGMKNDLAQAKSNMEAKMRELQERQAQSGNYTSEERAEVYKQYNPSIYFIKANRLVVEMDGEEESIDDYPMTGTGFMMADGRFVTARHIVEPWYYFEANEPNPVDILLNIVANNGGKVYIEYTAYSSGGHKMTFKSTDFSTDDSNDKKLSVSNPDTDEPVLVTHANFDDGNDWAVMRSSGSGGTIVPNATLSQSLPKGAPLTVLGFPFGLGVGNDIEPVQSQCQTAMSNMNNGVIVVSGNGIEPGNSGCPVFYSKDGREYVIGIVSVKASSLGYLVPIARVR